MRLAFGCAVVGSLAGVSLEAQSTPAPGIHRAVTAVAATNDEWTTTGLRINAGDMMIVRVPGYVTVGQISGERDANGAARSSTIPGTNGSLEYKIGVGAGKSAGKFAVHLAEESGEVKFRVRDSDYRDNRGQFAVDVVIVPASAIPPVSGADVAPTEDAIRIAVIATKSFLRMLVTSQEGYFSDNSRYSSRFDDLKHIQLPAGVALKSLVPAANGMSWTAIATHSRLPGVQCGIGINAVNPILATAAEAEPVCMAAPTSY